NVTCAILSVLFSVIWHQSPWGIGLMMTNANNKTGIEERREGNTNHYTLLETGERKKTTTTPTVLSAEQRVAATGALPPVRMDAETASDGESSRENTKVMADETAASAPSPEAKAKLAEAAANKDSKKPKILIVEDTQELAEVIQATLESAGMDADSVSHGSKGLERIKAATPDILLLDIGLPDMTGWKMLEELRDWKKDPADMPTVIVITAYGDPANRLIGKLQGIHSYLIKPFTSDEVEKVVRGALDATQ
ncbi:MAG: response regulator, partial [Chloroflexota bacterium]